MKIEPKDFRVRAGQKVHLKDWPTRIDPAYRSKDQYKEILKDHVARMSDLQKLLHASSRHALLLIFQAMDAGGKDGAIRHVMSGINPQGCRVTSFKPPSESELRHDFLWRAVRSLPERGQIGIFNRSYYEEVLIVRVHPARLRDEGVRVAATKRGAVWRERFRSIAAFENHLHGNGTHLVKFYLHLSKDEQRNRFIARIDDPRKSWKLDIADIEERAFWPDYRKAYEKSLSATSTRESPWYIVPADDKRNARLIVSQIVLETLESLDMAYPRTTPKRRRELLAVREKLAG